MSLSPEGLTKAMGASTSSCAPEGSHTSRLPSPQVQLPPKSKWVKCAARLPATCCCSCQLPKPAFKSLPSSKRDCSPWQHCRLQPQQPLPPPDCLPKLCALSSFFFFNSGYPVTMYTVSKPVSPVRLGSLKLSLCVLTYPS